MAVRNEYILVAEVVAIDPSAFDAISLEKTRDDNGIVIVSEDAIARLHRKFAALRDGHAQPSVMYVGELPEKGMHRHCIKLDLIHPLQTPTNPQARMDWVALHRIATLTRDYRRSLQTKLFTSVAVEGFKDPDWLSDADLDLFISSASAQIAAVAETVMTLRTQCGQDQMGSNNSKAAQQRRASLTSWEAKLVKLNAELAPYLEMKEERSKPT